MKLIYMKFDIQIFLLPKYAKWIIISLVFLLSVLIIYTYAGLFFINSSVIAEAVSDSDSEEISEPDETKHYLKAALFGAYMPADLNDDDVKQSMLNITIVGILYDVNPEYSHVILRSASGDEKTYEVGDKVPGGAVIKKIMPNGVLVERDGTLESLSLPKNELNFEPVAKPLKED